MNQTNLMCKRIALALPALLLGVAALAFALLSAGSAFVGLVLAQGFAWLNDQAFPMEPP